MQPEGNFIQYFKQFCAQNKVFQCGIFMSVLKGFWILEHLDFRFWSRDSHFAEEELRPQETNNWPSQ